MEKNEASAFRKQVLSHLYGLSDPSESVKQEVEDGTPAEGTETTETKPSEEKQTEDKPAKDNEVHAKTEKDTSQEKLDKTETADLKPDKGKEDEKPDLSSNTENIDSSAIASGLSSAKSEQKMSGAKSEPLSINSNKSTTTITTPTTTTSHLYSVLMAPLDGHSPYRDNILRYGTDDADAGPRKRMRMDNSSAEKPKTEPGADRGDVSKGKATADTNSAVGMDLTKNQKRKLKKKRRKHLLNKLEIQRAKDFIYSSENEQYSVEKLRTMIEDVTEFLDAIWDVYCSEARLKGESVEEERCRVAGVLKCLSASGEASWTDLQLLSRAKSVLVLRSKHLAASTIARVENELGYDSDTRSFIVRMLKFWMGEVVTKG